MITEFSGEHRWLSNFSPVRIYLAEIGYNSVEHAYVSSKSDALYWKLFCADENVTASEVKKRGRLIEIRSDWHDIKIDVMKECLRQKFNQEPYRSKLLATGTESIQEGNWWNDKFWGVCLKTNKGQNNLGKLIMEIRNELQK